MPCGQVIDDTHVLAGQDCSARLWHLPPEATGNSANDDSAAAKPGQQQRNGRRKPVSAVQPQLVAVYRCRTVFARMYPGCSPG